MADNTDTPVLKPAPAAKELQYVGPVPPPVIRFPGETAAYRADTLTAEQRARLQADNPNAKYWWK